MPGGVRFSFMASGAAGTADGPMMIIAADQAEDRPIVHDDVMRRMAAPVTRAMVAATRWAPVRRWLMGATEKQMPGLWGELLCRKRYAEDHLREALADGVTEVVLLGAGLDTLAYRVPEAAKARVYEVDLPANIERKEAALRRAYGQVPEHVTLVPLDFDYGDLSSALSIVGHPMDARTYFVWEAVTQYLTEDGVRATLNALSASGPGSRLVFTYIRADFLDGSDMYGAAAAYRRFVARDRPLWRFGLPPDEVAPLLAEYGWREVEQLGPAECAERYLRGRDLPVTEVERSVLAERT